MNIFASGQPTVNNRASIATWSLTVSFLFKDQATKFMEGILAAEVIPSNIEFEYDLDGSLHATYTVTIHDMSWANNLTRIAKIMETVDYNTGNLE